MTQTESPFIESLLATEAEAFDRPIEQLCGNRTPPELLQDCAALEAFWQATGNLYLRVRALAYLYYLHRFTLPALVEADAAAAQWPPELLAPCPIPLAAHRALQSRNFAEAIELLLREGTKARLNLTLSSGLATAYQSLALQNLANQVRASVRQEAGNQWMFRIGHPDDFPLRLRPELLGGGGPGGAPRPWLIEQTPVRMDLSHSSWSDIFFLGMDRPEFAKVINVSIDLAITGSAGGPVPPCLSALRVIDRPVIQLVSIDLECKAEVGDLPTLFDFGGDYLGLLKAAVIAAGIVPPGMEGARTPLERLLARLVGPGRGLELVSWVRDIPKGSRLAVSTNLLGSLIATCMRATGQIASLTGGMSEEERRIVASRAILGEWLGGSGGGWQDSGGVWPGVKLIEGCFSDGRIARPLAPSRGAAVTDPLAPAAHPEVSGAPPREAGAQARGALLPRHTRLDGAFIPATSMRALEESLILIHGGMAANVGPILEMVTERYLLRSLAEWEARQASLACTGGILEALREGDMRRLGGLTTEHFFGPLKAIIPWASNAFTERLIAEVSGAVEARHGGAEEPAQVGAARLGTAFWGFWMLGGMSGGGMGLIVRPDLRDAVKPVLREILARLKKEYERALPFAMDPVIYDFKVNPHGSAGLQAAPGTPAGDAELAFLREYFRLQLPDLLRKPPAHRSAQEHSDLNHVQILSQRYAGEFLASLLPDAGADPGGAPRQDISLEAMLERHGFDKVQHEQIREDLQAGRVGLSQNRLHPKTHIEDVDRDALQPGETAEACRRRGEAALRDGECMVLTLAAGAGSRWTQGAGVVKALHPFAPLNGVFRSFLEIHAAKTALAARAGGAPVPHVVTTSYLTHEAIEGWQRTFQERFPAMAGAVDLRLSEGRSVGLRLIPTERDLRYAWYELPQEKLDEQAEKVRDSVRQALMRWARQSGEGADYRDNLPTQCLHPVGHWYEVPNLLLNGSLHGILKQYPALRTILLHNIDTIGASLDPVLLGQHLLSGAPLTYEVIQRRFDDVGGGLARVNGATRLVEGFALPREEDEFRLSFYNTLTTWIDLDALLGIFGLTRADVLDPASLPGASGYARIREAVRSVAARMPTYITLKDTKKRWGRGQEDVYPVLQFERLWGDMAAYLASKGPAPARFIEVSRQRGQQLKDPAQLDAWSREGSLDQVARRVGAVL
jgi:hypothetical protein